MPSTITSELSRHSCSLFDRVELAPSALLECLGPSDIETMRHKLTQSGVLDSKKSAAFGPYWMILNLKRQGRDACGSATAELAFSQVGERAFRLSERSVLRLNPLKYLREAGQASLWPEAYDGSLNYIGPFPRDCSSLLEMQLSFIADMTEELRVQLGGSLSSDVQSRNETIRIRAVELARDRESNDAIGQAQLLAHSMLHDACLARRDVYRASSDTGAGTTVARWWLTKGGPALKVYAKAPQLLRLEVACDDRPAVNSTAGGEALRAEFTGQGTRELLEKLLPELLTLLDKLTRHADQVIEGRATPSTLALALSPMLEAMAGASTGGRPTASKTVAEVIHAYDSIVMTGQYRAKALRSDAVLGKLLRQLSSDGWPLKKHSTRHRYSLHPNLVRASYCQTVCVNAA